MGGEQAAQTLLDLRVRQLRKEGKKVDQETRKALLESIQETYAQQLDPRYAAARLWIDKIIEPNRTRQALRVALEAASLNPKIPEFHTGVLQV